MQILFNARIYTLDSANPIVSALAVDDGRIIATGTDAQILGEFESRGEAIDLGERICLPGMTDSHIHLQHYALGLQKVNCETSTRGECLARVQELALNTQPGDWILGHGWNQNDWPEGFGSVAELDAIAPDQPVYLTAKSLHAGWGNSEALRRAGISSGTPDPEGGRIQRNARGEPTGILFESAMSLISDVLPQPSLGRIAGAIEFAQDQLWRMGLTGVHDFDRQDCFRALQVLHQRGRLGIRVLKSIPLEALPQAAELGLRSGFGDDFLRIGSVKAFADGALGPRTAAMLQPYEDEPENRGIAMFDAEELYEYGRQAVENGLSLAVHAIGDRANHEVLEAYRQIRAFEDELRITKREVESVRLPHLRHRIEHVQIIHPDDAPRLAALNIIASMQPIHAASDYPAADRYWGKRAANSYAWRTLLDYRTRLAFGSDAPVDSPNPFWGLHAAVTRRRQDGSPGPEGWYPEQKLSIREALHGYTQGAAYAAGMENSLGKLARGYLADLLVLNADPFECNPAELLKVKPLAAMVGGEWKFSDLDLSDAAASDAHPLLEP